MDVTKYKLIYPRFQILDENSSLMNGSKSSRKTTKLPRPPDPRQRASSSTLFPHILQSFCVSLQLYSPRVSLDPVHAKLTVLRILLCALKGLPWAFTDVRRQQGSEPKPRGVRVYVCSIPGAWRAQLHQDEARGTSVISVSFS